MIKQLGKGFMRKVAEEIVQLVIVMLIAGIILWCINELAMAITSV